MAEFEIAMLLTVVRELLAEGQVLTFDWGVFWALIAALVLKGIASAVLERFRPDVHIVRTPQGFVIEK